MIFYTKKIHFNLPSILIFVIPNNKPKYVNIIIDNQLLKKLPLGIKGKIFINNPLEINNFDIFKFSENEKCLNKFKNDEIKIFKAKYKI